ncbi:small multidrug efflux protein [Microbacterium paludicola]|uniref:Small multidrug efflux protein n=1 Tax=Microbacterium paludicola TaxID=300019 RepID=A0A4Y9FZQ4_9MICO|nr:small multidrug efflux protein [Microbacterium paludicola]MBF0815556.1 small multidrug efflux protein [Microbacterium paludicola]TFU33818.1 small multidrug efflux protein [Microbacterium paludicola]
MNPIEDLIAGFQALVAQVPELVQPFIVLLAAAIPFIEGEGASPIGVVGGISPIVAGIAAAIGNFLAVLVVVLVSSRARSAVTTRRSARASVSTVSQGAENGAVMTIAEIEQRAAKPESKARMRVRRWMVRFGVPGASILAPLAIPTHFTAAMLVASGAARGWVLLWQAVSIVLWTALTTTVAWIALNTVLVA